MLEATNFKKSIMQRAEAMELKVLGLKRPIEAERLTQEQERQEMKDSYLHLEKTVIGHLKQLQHALEDKENVGSMRMPGTATKAMANSASRLCNAV